jgi:hypothetical protein
VDTFVLIVDLLASFATIALVAQLWIMFKHSKNDHERSRREVVIELQKLWMSRVSMEMRYAEHIIKAMSKEACENYWKYKSFNVPANCEGKLLHLLGVKQSELQKENGDIKIDEVHLHELRTHMSAYLNLLEIIYTAWHDNVGNREMIEKEFKQHVFDGGICTLDTIIETTEKYLPSLRAYSQDVKRRTKKAEGERKLD